MSEVLCYSIPYSSCSQPYFMALAQDANPVWLDSGKPHSKYGRFDILSSAPISTSTHTPHRHSNSSAAFLAHIEQANNTHFKNVQFNKQLELPFQGGVIGYLNYEFQHEEYKLPNTTTRPTAEIGIYDWAIIQDHKLKRSHCVFHPRWKNSKIEQKIAQATEHLTSAKQLPTDQSGAIHTPFTIDAWRATTNKATYLNAVSAIKDYIAAGDSYQVNYSQEFSAHYSGDPADAYLKMRNAVPSPYSAYLGFHSATILSVSPEKFLSAKGPDVITRPIKGTAPRGASPEQDKTLADNLLNSEKNQAENLMIVDLLRNDFSKNCLPHSVITPKLFTLESFENVHHLVSTIRGQLKPEVTHTRFLADCFPGGSITGAPKKRSMEIINELEPHSRGIYCGSIFYLSAHGHLDSSITIRTALLENGVIRCCGGGGIVADSNPEEEYAESLHKIEKFLDILR